MLANFTLLNFKSAILAISMEYGYNKVEVTKLLHEDKITIIIQKLVETYQPKKIYLFGSYAWGKPNSDSDLDLMIIVANSHEKPYRRMKPAYQALRGIKVSKDILVYTENEFETYASEPSSLFFKIKNEGIKLFEAA